MSVDGPVGEGSKRTLGSGVTLTGPAVKTAMPLFQTSTKLPVIKKRLTTKKRVNLKVF